MEQAFLGLHSLLYDDFGRIAVLAYPGRVRCAHIRSRSRDPNGPGTIQQKNNRNGIGEEVHISNPTLPLAGTRLNALNEPGC